MKHLIRVLTVVGVVVLLTAATSNLPNVNQHFKASGPLTASDTGITPTTIKIGYITSQTGVAASSFKGGDQGALARIKLQNAQGGIDGRKIELVARDDGAGNTKTQAQDLVENEKVFAVIPFTAFLAGDAATYLNQQGVPVFGDGFDGPEWGQQPNTNMFTFGPPSFTPFDGTYYTYDGEAKYMKSLGIKKLATARLRRLAVVDGEHEGARGDRQGQRDRHLLREHVGASSARRRSRPRPWPSSRPGVTVCSRRWSTRPTSGCRRHSPKRA